MNNTIKKGFTRTPNFGVTPKGGGFTLIELLVVVAIIGVLAAVVLAVLGGAKNKGSDAAVKSNLANARSQAEVFYNTNTASPNSYTGVCNQVAIVGGAKTLFNSMTAAYTAASLSSYTTNGTGTVGSATCNENGTSWAAEEPMKGTGSNQMWCVDSVGKSQQENNVSIGTTTMCP